MYDVHSLKLIIFIFGIIIPMEKSDFTHKTLKITMIIIKDYFSGNYTEPRLNFNTKIGENGKLYYWHQWRG